MNKSEQVNGHQYKSDMDLNGTIFIKPRFVLQLIHDICRGVISLQNCKHTALFHVLNALNQLIHQLITWKCYTKRWFPSFFIQMFVLWSIKLYISTHNPCQVTFLHQICIAFNVVQTCVTGQCLTCCGLVTSYGVKHNSQPWCREWLVVCEPQNSYLNQWWLFKTGYVWSSMKTMIFQENIFENVFSKWRPFCLELNVLCSRLQTLASCSVDIYHSSDKT